MPRTAAWQAFQTSRKEATELLRLAKSSDDTVKPDLRLSLRERQLRLFVVELLSHLQAYMRELLDEIREDLPDDWNGLTLLQKRYVSTHIHRRTSDLLQAYPETSLGEEKKAEQFTVRLSKCVEWHKTPSLLKAAKDLHDLEGFMNDNGSKSLDRALSLHQPDMRFSDWLGMQRLHRIDIDVLDNAIRLRNEVAHGKIEQRVTERDARKYRVVITRLVQKADEYVSGDLALPAPTLAAAAPTTSTSAPTSTTPPPPGHSEVF